MEATKLQCQRIGCNAMFTDDDNPEGSCQFHASPFFHDGMKEWSCCKQRSHDFSLFLEIPGCKTGKHTTEKPVLAKPAPKHPVAVPTSSPNANAATKDSCSRCQQGFFCSDHGSQPKEQIRQTLNTSVEAQEEKIESVATPPVKKVVIDINQPQVCKNKGCGKTFKEIDNHETACSHHPGPAVFHDRMKGWKCCDVHVNEFDEFMEIPPCSKGWHSSSSDDQAV
ncbi:Cysteine and histidine-rich domain-containing protein RAR1 [Cardamine amara subsp. amara]|uniref:Cysteine and histidine-rich domain-containing protein RAR1 n=1 Tax=Cardamine amara subsp. amara TaxID=228776 RepID=A0ABD1BYB4_CARAN